MSKKRTIYGAIAITALLVTAIPTSPAFSAAEDAAPRSFGSELNESGSEVYVGAHLSCEDAIELAASEIERPSEGYSFVCIPGQGAIATPGEAMPPERVEAAEAERQAAIKERATQRGPIGGHCSIVEYTRAIVNHISSVFDMCIYYGQKYPTYEWFDTIKVSGALNTGWVGHRFNFYVDNGWAGTNGSFSWTASLYRGQNLQVPVEIDFNDYSMVFPGTYANDVILRNNTTRETGTYHVRFHRMRIVVPSYDFDKDPGDFYASHRFVCNRADAGGFDQCEWPNGQEAF